MDWSHIFSHKYNLLCLVSFLSDDILTLLFIFFMDIEFWM